MTTISIDGVPYELEFLSQEARAQLASLQYTDQKINDLQKDLAILQTARHAYALALKSALEDNGHAKCDPIDHLQVRH